MFDKILDDIYIISTGNGSFPSSFSYYIDDYKKALIDTPLDTTFASYFDKRPVDMIICTHCHRDHVGCNHLFPESKIYAHPLDIPAMQSIDVFCHCYGVYDYGSNEFREIFLSNSEDFHPFPIHKQIQEGDIIELGKNKLEVIHTPGHTPGHCVLYLRDREILFTGDIDLTAFGPWYGNINSDVDELINSIKRIIDLNPRVILSGHKGMISKNIQDKLNRYLNRIFETETLILKELETPLTLEELINKKIIYKHWLEPASLMHHWEKMCIIVHLRRLLKAGMIQLNDDYYSKIS